MFAENSNLIFLIDSGISLPVFPSRTNLKLRNISVTLKIVKKILINLDLLKAAGPYCIPLVVLKNFGPEGLMVPVYKNVGERSRATIYCPVSLRSVVSKVFEKLVNNKIVDRLNKCGLFSDIQYGFRSSRSTADLLTVVSDRIGSAFNRFCTTRALPLVISQACGRV